MAVQVLLTIQAKAIPVLSTKSTKDNVALGLQVQATFISIDSKHGSWSFFSFFDLFVNIRIISNIVLHIITNVLFVTFTHSDAYMINRFGPSHLPCSQFTPKGGVLVDDKILIMTKEEGQIYFFALPTESAVAKFSNPCKVS